MKKKRFLLSVVFTATALVLMSGSIAVRAQSAGQLSGRFGAAGPGRHGPGTRPARNIQGSAEIQHSASGPSIQTASSNDSSGSYSLAAVAYTGNPAPGSEGGHFDGYFLLPSINNFGAMLFNSGLTTPIFYNPGDNTPLSPDGMFSVDAWRRVSQLIRSKEASPGGGIYAWTQALTQNDLGEGAFVTYLMPVSGMPGGADQWGVNTGVLRYSPGSQRQLIPVVVPYVTKAPDGAVFQGAFCYTIGLNNLGDIFFSGIVPTDKGIHVPGEKYVGLGSGIYKADRSGRIGSVIAAGDPAPEGGTFDFAWNPWPNDLGDVVFEGHSTVEPIDTWGPQSDFIYVMSDIRVRWANGRLETIARHGAPRPGGGVYGYMTVPVINNQGDVLFDELTDPADESFPYTWFLHSHGSMIRVVGRGDALPGGGHVVHLNPGIGHRALDNLGNVTFDATLDTSHTEVDPDGNPVQVPDSGLYVWSRGNIRMVCRTGTSIQGVGAIADLAGPLGGGWDILWGNAGHPHLNDWGQISFQATLTDGRGVLLVATPRLGSNH